MRRIIMAALAACAIYAVPAVAPQAIMTVPLVQSVGAEDAQAYLHVADAQNTAVLHTWNTGYPNCNGWDRCYQFPQAVRYSRINDTAVNVLVRAYFRAVPNRECTRWFYVRGNDPGYIAGGDSSWWCV